MSDNVKIKINEFDLTSPAGNTVDSTDIPFIPGFVGNGAEDAAAKNTPILCTTVKEFERLFGTTPKTFTAEELGSDNPYGLVAGDVDKSYVFAKELLHQGMSVVYVAISDDGNGDNCIANFYTNLKPVLELIKDRNEFTIKYITSGGYPSVCDGDTGAKDLCAYELMSVAAHRGDAVALIDYAMTDTKPLFDESNGIYQQLNTLFKTETENTKYPTSFGAAMCPWATYTCYNSLRATQRDSYDVLMPASFGYLMCVAKAIKTSPNWLAMAGVARGVVPNIKSLYTMGILTNTIAEDMQPKYGSKDSGDISINCITNIRPYGLTLWGNRTLKPVSADGTVALNFLNTRNMISDIKKLLYATAKSLMFEQNTDTLWLRFKSGVSPLLNQLKSGNGIYDYKIIKNSTKYDGSPLTKGELSSIIKIYPVSAVEYFELNIEISDDDVTIA